MTVQQPFLERDFYSDPLRRARTALVRLLRRPVRAAGFDFELRSFYSPIPNLDMLDDSTWATRSELPGIEFDVDRQIGLWSPSWRRSWQSSGRPSSRPRGVWSTSCATACSRPETPRCCTR